MQSTTDYKVGDVLKITYRRKGISQNHPDTIAHRAAIVRGIGGELYNGFPPLMVCFCQYEGKAVDTCGLPDNGQGAFTPSRIGTRPYGIIAVEKLGNDPGYFSLPHQQPKPGDTGYDCMC